MKFSHGLTMLALSCISVSLVHAGTVRETPDSEYAPTGKGYGELITSKGTTGKIFGNAKPNSNGPNANGINYHGGPVMVGNKNLYYIWYGNWSGNTATSILTDLGNSIGGSPY